MKYHPCTCPICKPTQQMEKETQQLPRRIFFDFFYLFFLYSLLLDSRYEISNLKKKEVFSQLYIVRYLSKCLVRRFRSGKSERHVFPSCLSCSLIDVHSDISFLALFHGTRGVDWAQRTTPDLFTWRISFPRLFTIILLNMGIFFFLEWVRLSSSCIYH